MLQSLAGYVASSQVPRRSKKNFHPCPNNISTIEFYNYRRRKKKKKRENRSVIYSATNFPQFLNVSYLHLVNAKIPRRIARSARVKELGLEENPLNN